MKALRMIRNSRVSAVSLAMFRLLTAAPRPGELTGAMDLVNHYGLQDYYETFCKKPLPHSIAERRYLYQVVGDVEVRKGEDMELGQLVQRPADADPFNVQIKPLDLGLLQDAFTFREAGPVSLSEADRGLPTIGGNMREEQKDKRHKRYHNKHKDKDKDHEKMTNGNGNYKNDEPYTSNHRRKKRKHEDGDGHKHSSRKYQYASKLEVSVLPQRARFALGFDHLVKSSHTNFST